MTQTSNVFELPRGEQILTIDGVEWRLRPTPEAIMTIEADLQRGVVGIIMDLGLGRWGLTDLATILHRCLVVDNVAATRPSRRAVAGAIMADGVQHHRDKATELLATVYGPEALQAMAKDAEGKQAGPADTT